MVHEAKDHEEEDKRKREEIDRRNRLDTLCYTLEKTIGDNKEKISEADQQTIRDAVAEARKAVESQDDERVKTAMAALEKEAHRIASVMYESAAGSGGPQAGGAPPRGKGGDGDGGAKAGGGKADDGVIDAEFEESN
jgi:molecular chaperone DnaK